MVDELSSFLDYARDRFTDSDDPLPCAPEDCAAVLGYLTALVPEFELSRQADAQDIQTRRADRRQAMLDGFQRARTAANNGRANGSGGRARPMPAPTDASGGDDDAGEVA